METVFEIVDSIVDEQSAFRAYSLEEVRKIARECSLRAAESQREVDTNIALAAHCSICGRCALEGVDPSERECRDKSRIQLRFGLYFIC